MKIMNGSLMVGNVMVYVFGYVKFSRRCRHYRVIWVKENFESIFYVLGDFIVFKV